MQANPYLSEFGIILLYIVGSGVFLTIMFFISRLLRPNKPNSEKQSSYESGEEAVGSAQPQFNIRFYVVAIMFILFEAELLFLFPWATVFSNKELIQQTNNQWAWVTFIEIIVFVSMLAIGLAYIWINGYIDWTPPKPTPPKYTSPIPKEFYQKINERYKPT